MTASLFGFGGNIALNTSSSLAEEQFTAAASQTLFTLVTFTYVPGTKSLWVFKNRLKLILGIDYTETSPGSFTLLTPATVGDKIDVVGFPITAVTVIDNTIFHSFPFFTTDGNQNNIPLDSTGRLPFYKADSTSSPIPII
jgi:hypothetical protein